MATGGYNNKGNNGNRARPYALMLLLAFGAALFGVLVVHRFREKRIFNLLIKEKDRDVLSLQHLLQKEKDHNQEMKKKAEVMRVKIYSLRSQKMELDSSIREMQSTISSLRDEQKLLESALEENQKEIRMLREKDSSRNYSQEAYLDGMLKQKEAEIQELKRQLETLVNPVRGQMVDPSSDQQVNSTSASSEKQESKSDIIDVEKKSLLSRSTEASNGEDQNGNKVIGDGTKPKTEEGAEKVVNFIGSMDSSIMSQMQGSNSGENPTDDRSTNQSNDAKVQGANDESQEAQQSTVADEKDSIGENTILDTGNISRDKEGNGDARTTGTEEDRRKNLEEDEKVGGGTSQAGFGKLEVEPSNFSSINGLSSNSTAKSKFASAGKKKRKKHKVAGNGRRKHKVVSETDNAVFANDGKSSGDEMETENRGVRGIGLHEVTARSRYHDQSSLSKANKSDHTEDGMHEDSKPVEHDDIVKEGSDWSGVEGKAASDEETMNGESSTKSKEDTREVDKPSDSLDGKSLEFATSKRTKDLNGTATDVQQDQEKKGDDTWETSSDSDKVELPTNRTSNGNVGGDLTAEVEKWKLDAKIRQEVEQGTNTIQDEINEPETNGW